jgi:hypothetical protein
VKILFAMQSAEYLRYYDDTIRLLAGRGHRVVLAVNHDRGDKKLVRLDGMAGTSTSQVEAYGVLPAADPFWGRTATGLRGTMDFVRYLDPYFSDAHALRARIRRKVLPRPLHALDRIRRLGPRSTRLLLRGLAGLEQAIPTVPALDRALSDIAPDVIVVSPLVDAASPQVDLVKSARRLGMPVAVAIASWDNLTNKGLLRIAPDLLIVWNDAQKAEATRLHGIDPSRVTTTGAQLFDRWFDRAPSRDLEAFCVRVGLAATTPFVLFAGSSGFISEGRAEVAFVRGWIGALRASADPAIAKLPVLMRPHPYNAKVWTGSELSDLPDVAIWPRGAYNPVDEDNRADFFDSLHHSVAVVGINTSAMIEAAIVGRPVLSIRTSEFAGTQEGTLHFHYLLPEHGGFLRVAGSLPEHVRQLSDVLANPVSVRQQTEAFVGRFIRPRGRAVAATPVMADAIETLAHRAVPARRMWRGLWLRPVMWTIAMIAAAAEGEAGAGWRRWRKSARLRWHRARKSMARVARTATSGR